VHGALGEQAQDGGAGVDAAAAAVTAPVTAEASAEAAELFPAPAVSHAALESHPAVASVFAFVFMAMHCAISYLSTMCLRYIGNVSLDKPRVFCVTCH
jgi:hypothetical protein